MSVTFITFWRFIVFQFELFVPWCRGGTTKSLHSSRDTARILRLYTKPLPGVECKSSLVCFAEFYLFIYISICLTICLPQTILYRHNILKCIGRPCMGFCASWLVGHWFSTSCYHKRTKKLTTCQLHNCDRIYFYRVCNNWICLVPFSQPVRLCLHIVTKMEVGQLSAFVPASNGWRGTFLDDNCMRGW